MVHLQPWRVNYNIWIILHADKIYNSTPARQPGKLSIALQINDKNKNRAVVGKLHDATKILIDMECIVSWRLPWKKRWSSHLRRLIKTCLKFSRWICICTIIIHWAYQQIWQSFWFFFIYVQCTVIAVSANIGLNVLHAADSHQSL